MAADISGDGSLDVKEFLSFSHPEEDPAMRPHVLAQVYLSAEIQHPNFSGQVLKEKDTDGDGELSFQEYVGDRGQGKDKEWLISEKERLFKVYVKMAAKSLFSRFDSELDKNGDASLNTEEILAWIIPSNEEIATDEVNLSGFTFVKAIAGKYISVHFCQPKLF